MAALRFCASHVLRMYVIVLLCKKKNILYVGGSISLCGREYKLMCKYSCHAKAVYRKVFLLIAKLQVHAKNNK